MKQLRRLVFLVYPEFKLLNLAGPVSVFTTANRLHGEQRYKIIIASSSGDIIYTHGNIPVATVNSQRLRIQSNDTVLVVGAHMGSIADAMEDNSLLNILQRASAKAERYGSVCSGSFILGAAGLLDNKRVATHWGGCAQLSSAYDGICVEQDALFVVDDRLWTSAGVTTGIDMALTIIGKDISKALMKQVAKELVVSMRRPGGHQSRFSNLLDDTIPSEGHLR